MTSRNQRRASHPPRRANGGRAVRSRTSIILWTAAIVIFGLGVGLALNRLKGRPFAWVDRFRPLTFHKDVAPIIFNHCSTCHHPDEAAPFNLLTYADVKKHTRQIADVTRRRVMPPWLPEPGYGDFISQRLLSEREIQLVQRWVDQGAPEGDARDAPAPPVWREGWQLGQPDLIVELPQPYTLAADGKDVYRNFVAPIPTSTRRYVKGIELRPGNAKAVHHAFMLIDPTRDSRRRDEQDAEPGFPGLHTPPSAQSPAGHFLSWQPGKLPISGPEELAWTLEKNSDLILQMHLRPTGKPETIRPLVGFHFTDKPPTRTPLKFGLWTHAIDIPPGDANYTVRDTYVTPVDLEILRVLPHAHYLGRQLHGLATLPDGTQRWLIRIDHWDFNWQGDYAYTKPMFLPKGTTISMQYTYDNSTNNARNPNQPPRRVRYGVNSSDEMAELWLQVLPRQPADAEVLEKDFQPRILNSAISYNTYLLGLDPNNAKAHTEIGKGNLFLNRRTEAFRSLRRAIELKPEEDEPHYYLGLLFRMNSQLPEAKAEFQTVILSNPEHYKAHGNLGLILLQEGNFAEAERHLQSALKINPEDTIARDALAELARARVGAGKTN
jgi:Flp pilus assembly protein TadD